MKKKNIYIFLIINYLILIFCWVIFSSNLIEQKDNNFIQFVCLANVIIHGILIFGGEGMIYFFLTIKAATKDSFIVLLISLFINVCICIVTGGLNPIILYLSINQIVGVIIGLMIRVLKNRIYSNKSSKENNL